MPSAVDDGCGFWSPQSMKLPPFSRLSSLFFVGCAVSALGLVACGDDADTGGEPSGEAGKGGASGKAGAAGKAGSGGNASAGTGGSSAGTGGSSSGAGGTAGTGGSAGQSTGGAAGTSGSAGAAGANAGSAGTSAGAAGNGGNAGTNNTAGNAGASGNAGVGGSAGTNAGGSAGAASGGSAGAAGGTGGSVAGGAAGSAGAPNDGVARYHVSCLLNVAGTDPAKAIRFLGVRNASSPATVSVTLTPLVVGATKLSQTTGKAVEGTGNVISATSAILNFGNDFIIPANANPVNGVEAELDNVTMPVALVSPSYACGELQGVVAKPTQLSLAGAGDRCLFDLVEGGPDAAITAVSDISRFTASCP